MKRSEMVDLITIKLLQIMHNEYGEGQKMAKDDAELILQEIEYHGMLPPEIDKIIEKHQCTVNEWEPETNECPVEKWLRDI